VEQEIVDFKKLHGEDRVLALIVDGEPWASNSSDPEVAATECFPKALRHRLGPDGVLSEQHAEPIAADAREGKDGRENAVIKLMAGLLGVGFDDLRRREQEYQRRRVRRLQLVCAGFALLFIAAVSAAVYAVRLFNRVGFGRLDNQRADWPLTSWAERAPVLLLAVLVVASGLWPRALTGWSETTTASLALRTMPSAPWSISSSLSSASPNAAPTFEVLAS
jgi:hypothetical protein